MNCKMSFNAKSSFLLSSDKAHRRMYGWHSVCSSFAWQSALKHMDPTGGWPQFIDVTKPWSTVAVKRPQTQQVSSPPSWMPAKNFRILPVISPQCTGFVRQAGRVLVCSQGGSKNFYFVFLQETEKIDKIWWKRKKRQFGKEKLSKPQSFNQ